MSMRRSLSAVLFSLAVSVALASCSGPTDTRDTLAAARARWTSRGPASYSVTIVRMCECLPEMSGPVVLTVRNGTVESRLYANDAAVSAAYAPLFPPVEGLFDIVDGAIDGEETLSVSYDEQFGFPTRIAIGDPNLDAPVYIVRDFHPR
jgi:hypothetical protein